MPTIKELAERITTIESQIADLQTKSEARDSIVGQVAEGLVIALNRLNKDQAARPAADQTMQPVGVTPTADVRQYQ